MIIVQWLLFSLAVMLVAYVVPGIAVKGFASAMLLSVVIGIINVFVKPFLSLITLPINFLTLGIFGLILNALLLLLAGYLTAGISINGFWSAFLGSIILSILGGIIFQISDKK